MYHLQYSQLTAPNVMMAVHLKSRSSCCYFHLRRRRLCFNSTCLFGVVASLLILGMAPVMLLVPVEELESADTPNRVWPPCDVALLGIDIESWYPQDELPHFSQSRCLKRCYALSALCITVIMILYVTAPGMSLSPNAMSK